MLRAGLKVAVHTTVHIPVLMSGSETRALKKTEQNLLERIEMSMLLCTCENKGV